MRIGEIVCRKQFLLFSQCFSPYIALIFHFECCFDLDCSKILLSGNGLTPTLMIRSYVKALFGSYVFGHLTRQQILDFLQLKWFLSLCPIPMSSDTKPDDEFWTFSSLNGSIGSVRFLYFWTRNQTTNFRLSQVEMVP